MKNMSLAELDALLASDEAYVAAAHELRPELNLANDILVCRVEAGLTQAGLAQTVGTNQANISRLESGLANPTLKLLKKVARALGAELDVRLRRPDDLPGPETLEGVVRTVAARLETTSTSTRTVARRLNWQGQADRAVVAAQSTEAC